MWWRWQMVPTKLVLRWDVMPTPARGIQENTIAIACKRSFGRRLRRPVSSRPIWENTATGWIRGQHNTVECAISKVEVLENPFVSVKHITRCFHGHQAPGFVGPHPMEFWCSCRHHAPERTSCHARPSLRCRALHRAWIRSLFFRAVGAGPRGLE